MTTNNSVNSPLSGTTGTGNFTGSTSPSITTPKINQINDTNGNASIKLSATASAVNYLNVSNGATGSPMVLSADGTDTNIGFQMNTKGAAPFAMLSAATSNQLTFYAGTNYQRVTNFAWADVSSNNSVTWPNATGTVALSGASQNVTFGQLAANGSNIASYAFTAHGATNQNLVIGQATSIANAVCLGAVNDANSANIPLELRASGLYCSTGMVNSTAGNIVKWNPTGGQFTYDTQPLAISLGGTGVSTNNWTAGSLTFSPTTQGIVGTTTNDNASAGYVGEYQSIYNSTGVVGVAGVAGNVTSISLSAGDWDVYGQCAIIPNAGQVIAVGYSSLTLVSASFGLAAFGTAAWIGNNFIGDGSSGLGLVPAIRLSLSSTTTVYLAYYANVGSVVKGGIWARRAR